MKLKDNLSLEFDRSLVPVKKHIEQLELNSFKKYLESMNINII